MDLFECYPYKKRTDLRTAMSLTLADFFREQEFSLPKSTETFKLAEVYTDWATFNSTASTAGGKLPAAAILPDRPVYEEMGFTPAMIEKTWSGGDPNELDDSCRPLYPIGNGTGDGFALFALAEMVVPFVVLFRGVSKPMRSAFVMKAEELFVEDGSLFDPGASNPRFLPRDITEHPIRYGRLLTMGRYYDRTVRFTLQSQQLMTNTQAALENRWMVQLELTGHAQLCALRRVRAMRPQIRLFVDDTIARQPGG